MIIYFESGANKGTERANLLLQNVKNGAVKAVYNAMNRAGDSAKTEAGRFAAETYAITKGTFMSNVTSKKRLSASSGGVMGVAISFAGEVLPLLTFNTKYAKDGQIQTQVMRNGGATTLQHAFAARISGHTGIYERVGNSRFPVEGKYGPSTAHMMQNDEVIEKMNDKVNEVYEQRIEHEILRLMNGWGG